MLDLPNTAVPRINTGISANTEDTKKLVNSAAKFCPSSTKPASNNVIRLLASSRSTATHNSRASKRR